MITIKMSSEQIQLVREFDRNNVDQCPLIRNSSGYPTIVDQSIAKDPNNKRKRIETCTYQVNLFDTEQTVNEAITTFVNPQFSSVSEQNERCIGSTTEACKNWNEINNKLLRTYCERSSFYSVGGGGACPNYSVNYFDPRLPISNGCNLMVDSNSICFQWREADSAGVNQAIQNYCNRFDTQDCACVNASNSIIFSAVNPDVPNTCWWLPCQQTENERFLIPKTDIAPPVCATDVCIQVNNIFAEDSVLQNVNINEVSNCGGTNRGQVPWFEQWWFWIIVLTVVLLILATIIFYTTQ